MHVALLANLKKNAPTWPGMSPDRWDDLDSGETIESISRALEAGGHRVTFLEGNVDLVDHLRTLQPDICFNICEGYYGDGREAQVPAILEMLRLPYTGSQVLTLALALDKPMTKRVLWYHGLPTPPFQVFERANEPMDPELRFPLFVKPSREGTGMGVSAESIVRDDAQLRAQLVRIFERYDEPALVEHYIEGREVTVGLVGNLTSPVAWRVPEDEDAPRITRGLTFFPPLEVNLEAYPKEEGGIYTSRMKTELAHEFHYHCPAPLDDDLIEELKPYILEVNPLPGLNPGYSDLCIEAAAAGWTYEQLINQILDLAIERYGI
jgi:D-alanine-D-alanine ligase